MTIQEKLELLIQLQVPLGAQLGGEALLFDGGTLQQFENGAILGDRVASSGFPGGDSVITFIESILPGLVLRRVFDSLTPQEIRDLVGEAQAQDPQYEYTLTQGRVEKPQSQGGK